MAQFDSTGLSRMADPGDAFLLTEVSVHRRYTIIPRDQQDLLSRPDAWDTKGIPNIPSKVLQDVKNAYVKRLKQAVITIEDSPSEDEEEEEVPFSWPPTPTQPKRTPVRGAQLPVPLSSPVSPRNEQSRQSQLPVLPSSPALPRQEQSPRDHLPVPSSLPAPVKQAASSKVSQKSPEKARPLAPDTNAGPRFRQANPPSSLASEPDIEYQPPRAVTDVVKPVDPVPFAAELRRPPAPTPPSAQQQLAVPCTYQENIIPAQRQQPSDQPAPKRRRLMKPVKFESSQTVNPAAARAPSGGRLAPVDLTDTQTSNSTSTSPVIATASLEGRPRLGVLPGTRSRGRSAVLHSSPPAPVVHPVQDDQCSNGITLPPNGPASQAPYVAFTVAYPDYEPKGNLGDFVRAALSIEQLQKMRSLAEFLYDDYIRVFAHSYVDYIERKPSRPLTAIQWYNENVHRPVYTKGIITRGNVMDVLEHYPERARSARWWLGESPTPSLPLPTSPSVQEAASTADHKPTNGVISSSASKRRSRPKSASASRSGPDNVSHISSNAVAASSSTEPTQNVSVTHTPEGSTIRMSPFPGFCSLCWGFDELHPVPKDHREKLHVYCKNCQLVFVGEEAMVHVPASPSCYGASYCIRCRKSWAWIVHDEIGRGSGSSNHCCLEPTNEVTEEIRFCRNGPCNALLRDELEAKRHFTSCPGVSPARRARGLHPDCFTQGEAPKPLRAVGQPHTPQPRHEDRSFDGSSPAAPCTTSLSVALRPDQIEKVEQLRSVRGYVITMSQVGGTSGKGASPSGLLPPLPPKVEEEEDDLPLSQPPLSDVLRSSPPPIRIELQPNQPSVPPRRQKSPQPSFGDILTQPPATARSCISDFTKSVESIPETAIKPKDVPPFSYGSTSNGTVAPSSSRKPPPSSMVSISSNPKRKKLTKAERWAEYLKQRVAQSSAPQGARRD